MKRLLAFRGLPHDPQGVLAAIYQFAFVGIELCVYFCFCIIFDSLARMELRIATFADTKGNGSTFHDPQFALLHDCSLAHSAGRA